MAASLRGSAADVAGLGAGLAGMTFGGPVMTTRSPIILAALALAAAGCGGPSAEERAKTRLSCLVAVEAKAEAAVAAEAYQAGRLGSPEQVATETRHLNAPGVDPVSFQRGDGSLIPYGQMTVFQRDSFAAWQHTDRVQNVIGDEQARAVAAATERGKALCRRP